MAEVINCININVLGTVATTKKFVEDSSPESIANMLVKVINENPITGNIYKACELKIAYGL